MIRKTAYASLESYITRDGSVIREMMHPGVHGNARQSLAEATVPPGGATLAHRHLMAEELYHIVQGSGRMTLDGESFPVGPGDTVCIESGRRHNITNTGAVDLRVLCCCSPACSHEDTLLDDVSEASAADEPAGLTAEVESAPERRKNV